MSLDITLTANHCACCNRYDEVYWCNITHNLGPMARKAGLYECLWNCKENGYLQAKHITEHLENGLKRLKRAPYYYKKFDAENGWGTYKGFVPFVEALLEACKENPTARIEVDK